MKKAYIIGALVVGACVCSAALYYMYAYPGGSPPAEESTAEVSEPVPAPDVPREVPPGFKEYKSGRFGFSVLYPESLAVKESMETATSYSITFSNADGAGFQIYVVAYKGDTISEEQFKTDVPSGVRKDETAGTLGGVAAVQFSSEDSALGETAEVWSIHSGYLFEITTYRAVSEDLMNILRTWEFTR